MKSIDTEEELGPLMQVMHFDAVRAERDDSIVPRALTDFEPYVRRRLLRRGHSSLAGVPNLAYRQKSNG
jgi:hypothetical protein